MSEILTTSARASRPVPTLGRLMPADRAALARHLMRLSGWDRVSRWGGARSDGAIERECAALDLTAGSAQALAIGVRSPDGLIGAAIALRNAGGEVEIAVSVDAPWRRRGVGTTLVWEAWQAARRDLGVRRAILRPDSDNLAMIRLLRRLGGVATAEEMWELRGV